MPCCSWKNPHSRFPADRIQSVDLKKGISTLNARRKEASFAQIRKQSTVLMTLAPLRFAIALLALYLAIAALTLAPGEFRITAHEIDTLHALDIAYRILEGWRPHLDFMTPLGRLGFAPIVFFLEEGYRPGLSLLLSQILVAGVLLPGIWWVGVSRLESMARGIFGAGMLILVTALVYGGQHAVISASMFYNRWCWCLASLVFLMVFLPARKGWENDLIDGVLIGLCGAGMVLIKATFFVGLAPLVLVHLVQSALWRRYAIATLTFLGALGVATILLGGFAFWDAYIRDLLHLAFGPVRPEPSLSVTDLLSGISTLTQSLLLGAAIIFWRKTGLMREGLLLLVAGVGVTFITWQNWGNDPKWLFLLALLLLSLKPIPDRVVLGVPAPIASKCLAVIAFVLFMPSIINLSTSHIRHFNLPADEYVPVFGDLQRADLKIEASRAYRAESRMPIAGIAPPPGVTLPPDSEEEDAYLNGTKLDRCKQVAGYIGWMQRAVAQLEAVEEAVGRTILVTDLSDHVWLFGPFRPPAKMAPWYYGDDDGYEDVDYVLVPICPASIDFRRGKLERISELGWTLEEILRTDLFILVKRTN